MTQTATPSLADFLAAPVEAIARVAPATVVYAPGGTRRQAVFEGIEPWSEEFIDWAWKHTMASAELLFRHGVRNLLLTALTPGNFREVNRYRPQLLERTASFIAGADALATYRRFGWRVRLIGAECAPELAAAAAHLRRATAADGAHTIYWTVAPDEDSFWQSLWAIAQQTQFSTRAEAIHALYGEEIEPATLYLAFGKPLISQAIIPPLLQGELHCYWSQQPGYTLTERQLRTILYDYAHLRPTWREEKLERAHEALAHRQAWQEGPILGLGMRLGPFWYPAPMSSQAWPDMDET